MEALNTTQNRKAKRKANTQLKQANVAKQARLNKDTSPTRAITDVASTPGCSKTTIHANEGPAATNKANTDQSTKDLLAEPITSNTSETISSKYAGDKSEEHNIDNPQDFIDLDDIKSVETINLTDDNSSEEIRSVSANRLSPNEIPEENIKQLRLEETSSRKYMETSQGSHLDRAEDFSAPSTSTTNGSFQANAHIPSQSERLPKDIDNNNEESEDSKSPSKETFADRIYKDLLGKPTLKGGKVITRRIVLSTPKETPKLDQSGFETHTSGTAALTPNHQQSIERYSGKRNERSRTDARNPRFQSSGSTELNEDDQIISSASSDSTSSRDSSQSGERIGGTTYYPNREAFRQSLEQLRIMLEKARRNMHSEEDSSEEESDSGSEESDSGLEERQLEFRDSKEFVATINTEGTDSDAETDVENFEDSEEELDEVPKVDSDVEIFAEEAFDDIIDDDNTTNSTSINGFKQHEQIRSSNVDSADDDEGGGPRGDRISAPRSPTRPRIDMATAFDMVTQRILRVMQNTE